MGGDDLHEQIGRVEARIEALRDALERCRKIDLIAKAAIAIGAAWLFAIPLGAARLDLTAVIGVTSFLIGGVVALGSNAGTARQVAAEMAQAEALRIELIGKIHLRLVPAVDEAVLGLSATRSRWG